MKKEYTVEDFKMKSIIHEAKGEWSRGIFTDKPCWNINYSSLLTELIQEAGKHCKSYASDLFISWSSIEKALEHYEYTGGQYLFGFRESGVDHVDFVLSRVNNDAVYGRDIFDVYKALWILEISVEKPKSCFVSGKISMQLGKFDLKSL